MNHLALSYKHTIAQTEKGMKAIASSNRFVECHRFTN